MKIHRITDEVEINLSLDEAWAFFADPHNLQKLTPENMGFKYVLEPDKNEIYPGMIMCYKVAPVAGIPLNWVTEITQVQPKKRFVDEQRHGPFGFWHHIHEFEVMGNHTLCRDTLYYGMPFGFLGSIAHALFAKEQIAGIFAFRKEKVQKLFG